MKLFIVIILSLTLSIMADEKEALKKSIVKLNSMRVELLNKHKNDNVALKELKTKLHETHKSIMETIGEAHPDFANLTPQDKWKELDAYVKKTIGSNDELKRLWEIRNKLYEQQHQVLSSLDPAYKEQLEITNQLRKAIKRKKVTI